MPCLVIIYHHAWRRIEIFEILLMTCLKMLENQTLTSFLTSELNRNITCFGPWALSLKNSVVILSKRIADLAHSCVIVAVVTCLQHSPWWPGSAPTAVRSSSLLLIWLRIHSAPSSVPQYTNIPTQVQMQ